MELATCGTADEPSRTGPAVAIVIPMFRHSGLVVDALSSALSQEAPFRIVTILVNDGCPYPESHLLGMQFAHQFRDRIVYIRKPNGGLSSARNAGIEFVLKHLPTVQAIFFLDADNRLQAGAIAAAYDFLGRERASWVYPNIRMFGLSAAFDVSQNFSKLRLLSENYCEAGSLVGRQVVDAGVRFDENMTSGYEDWDFWLQAIAKGFAGKCFPYFGFEYRRRPESMLMGSYAEDSAIRSYLRKKHRGMLTTRNVLKLEAEEYPRFAVFDFALDTFYWRLDRQSKSLDLKAFDRLLWAGLSDAGERSIPTYLVVTTRSFLNGLADAGLLCNALWLLERALTDANVATLTVENHDNVHGLSVEWRRRHVDGEAKSLALIRSELLEQVCRDSSTRWIESLTDQSENDVRVNDVLYRLPENSRVGGLATGGEGTCAKLAVKTLAQRLFNSRFRGSHNLNWQSGSSTGADAANYASRAAGIAAPMLSHLYGAGKGDIAFVLPLAGFGGVEKVTYNIADQLKREGWNVHLVVTGENEAQFPEQTFQLFSTINFLGAKGLGWAEPSASYMGTGLATSAPRSIEERFQLLLGLLSGFDVVYTSHDSEAYVVAGALRRRGIMMINHQHVVDLTEFGRPNGHPYLAVAYEHAYDLIATCSGTMTSWLAGMGIPESKLVTVENAPSFEVSTSLQEEVMAARRARQPEQPLRVLVLGRLDWQKGLDRVAALYDKIEQGDDPIVLRIVGASVINQLDEGLPIHLLHPPVWTDGQLIEVFQDADVLLVMSRWEGLPLAVLEAASLGVVPVCTRVGAIAEAVDHGENGFLLDSDRCVEEALTLLRMLVADRELLNDVAERAMTNVRRRSWETATRPLRLELDRFRDA